MAIANELIAREGTTTVQPATVKHESTATAPSEVTA